MVRSGHNARVRFGLDAMKGRAMKPYTVTLVLVLVAIAAFAILNWGVFVAPTELTLGFTTIRLPLGLLMLGLLVLVAALFLLYVVFLQASALLDTRRHGRELRANRELADQAEASRFTELRSFLASELAQQTRVGAESKAEVLARIDRLERDLRVLAEQTGNSLAASIGELDDRLERGGAQPAAK